MDRRKTNKVGRKGYDISNETIVSLYTSGLTMKEVGEKLGISHWTVLDRLKKAGVRKNKRHKVDHTVFAKYTPASCYWAGFIAADGFIDPVKNNVGVELHSKDEQHLLNLCKFSGRDGSLWRRERTSYGNKSAHSSMTLVSKQIVKDLNDNFNITPKKSLTLQPPTQIPSNMQKHFIRGYIDGDGSVGWHKHNDKPRLNIVGGSHQMLQWVRDVVFDEVNDIGNPSIFRRAQANTHTIEYMGNQVYSILDWLYMGSNESTRLKRKYNRYSNY